MVKFQYVPLEYSLAFYFGQGEREAVACVRFLCVQLHTVGVEYKTSRLQFAQWIQFAAKKDGNGIREEGFAIATEPLAQG